MMSNSKSATFTETETEEIDIDGTLVQCTFMTTGSALLGGNGSDNDGTITLNLTPSNITTSYTGSPAMCGSGSCAVVQGDVTLTRSP